MRSKPPLLDKPFHKKRHLTEDEKRLWQKLAEEGFVIKTPAAPLRENKMVVKKELLQTLITKVPTEKHHGGIHARLDLHGHTLSSAYDALQEFIINAYEHSIRMTLIITGKGKIENYETLRSMLPRWLAEANLNRYIISCESAETKHGGVGAWYVRIRKKR